MSIEVILRDGKEYASDELLLQGIYRSDATTPMGAVTIYAQVTVPQLPFKERMRVVAIMSRFNSDKYPFRFQNGCGLADLIMAKYGSIQFP